jgi:crossover junction endodeoxyribonuclease RuvC
LRTPNELTPVSKEIVRNRQASGKVTIGFDPGTALLGYGVLRGDDSLGVVDYGVVETNKADPMPRRLLYIYNGVMRLIRQHRPDVVALEQLFFSRNVTTALTVGQARGVVMLAAAQSDLEVAEYTPAEVKQAVSGYGKATKAQMQEMVRVLLGLDIAPYPDDAADALAVAICHIQHMRFQDAVNRSTN